MLCVSALALLAALAFSASVRAAPGRPDPSFGQGGTVTGDLGPSYGTTSFQAIEAQSDGSLLATRDGGILRYRADGSLDMSFARVQAPAPEARAVQEDGKVLTLGSGGVGINNRLLRANPDGTPDPTFSGASVPISVGEILPLSSGKILVVGNAVYEDRGKAGSILQVALARFEPNGALDTSFGNAGLVRLHSDYGIEPSGPLGIASRPGEAAVVITGTSLVGLTAGGQVDSAFGNAGQVDLPGETDTFHSLAGEKLLVAVNPPALCCEANSIAIVRYTATGVLDPSFGGGDGKADGPLAGINRAGAVLWEEDGSILVGGSHLAPSRPSSGCAYPIECLETPTVTRFTPEGLSDSSFGTGGTVELDPLTANTAFLGILVAGVRALAVRPGGALFVGGGSGPGTSVAFLAALGPDGRLQPGFGDGGIVRERNPSPAWSEVADLAVARDGSILVGGGTDSGGGSGPLAVARYKRNGALDRGFGAGAGFVRVPTALGSDWHLNALAVDRRGRPILLSGKSSLVRLTPTGELDASFAEGGADSPNTRGELHALAVLPSGKLLVGGSVIIGKHSTRMSVFRLRPDGRLDRSFGHRGTATVPFGHKGHSGVRQFAIQPDGRIVLVGYVRESMALARLMPDGSLDRGFGRDGRIVPPVAQTSKATAVAMQGGKVLVAGWQRRSGKVRALLLRYTHDGRLDRRFAKRGLSSSFAVIPGKRDSTPEPVQILPTGRRIVVVRRGSGRPVLAYRRNGGIDRPFGHSRAIAPNRLSGPLGALQEGSVVLAWNARGPGGPQFSLQRLTAR